MIYAVRSAIARAVPAISMAPIVVMPPVRSRDRPGCGSNSRAPSASNGTPNNCARYRAPPSAALRVSFPQRHQYRKTNHKQRNLAFFHFMLPVSPQDQQSHCPSTRQLNGRVVCVRPQYKIPSRELTQAIFCLDRTAFCEWPVAISTDERCRRRASASRVAM
jgi:hypothetical protein